MTFRISVITSFCLRAKVVLMTHTYLLSSIMESRTSLLLSHPCLLSYGGTRTFRLHHRIGGIHCTGVKKRLIVIGSSCQRQTTKRMLHHNLIFPPTLYLDDEVFPGGDDLETTSQKRTGHADLRKIDASFHGFRS